MADAWNISNEVKEGADSLRIHSLDDGTLKPSRQLLHELIIQAVTERKVDSNPNIPYSLQLYDLVEKITSSEAYKELENNGNFTRENVAFLLDQSDVTRLPSVRSSDQVTIMVTGGPATGKTALIAGVMEEHHQITDNAVKINPDDYKAILADPEKFGISYADVAHREGANRKFKRPHPGPAHAAGRIQGG
jgi:hypothetical protein